MQIYGGIEKKCDGKRMKFHIDRPFRFGTAASGMWAHRKIWMFFCLYRLIVQCRRAALSRDIGFSIAQARVLRLLSSYRRRVCAVVAAQSGHMHYK